MNNIELIAYKVDELKKEVGELEKIIDELNKNYFELQSNINNKIVANKDLLEEEIEEAKQELRSFVLRIFALFGTLIGVIIFVLRLSKNL